MNMDWNTLLISSVSSVITYFIGLRKSKKEIESITLINLEKSLEIYKSMIDDLTGRINQLNAQVKELNDKVDDLMTENHNLKLMLEKKSKKTPL
jgi:CII-binding regulator of phage lambda lysogenization HflD